MKLLQVFAALAFLLPLVSCGYSYINFELFTTWLGGTSTVPLKLELRP